MITITITNTRGKLSNIGVPTLQKLRKLPLMSIRVPGAFFARQSNRGWDGKFNFITESGQFDIGKLPQVIEFLEGESLGYKIIDERTSIRPRYIVKKLGRFPLRDYQIQAQLSLTRNKVGGIYFPIGFMKAATNAGKSIIAASVHRAYDSKTLFLLNSTELFQEMLREIPQYLRGEVGSLQSGKVVWGNFMIVMVKSLLNNIGYYAPYLKEYKVLIVDEADLSTSKTYLTAMKYLFHCPVRLGLSGTQFTKMAKDKLKREKVRALFGENIFEISNKDLQEAGYSSKIQVDIFDGNLEVELPKDYKGEYDQGITHNNKRHHRVLRRVEHHITSGNTPILVFAQYHDHIENLYNFFSKHLKGHSLAYVHHKSEYRDSIIERFRQGKLEILIGSMILKRGKNFPLTKAIINAGGGDSFTNVLQGPIGRAVRKHESKELTYVEDFMDKGKYLKKHSKHRKIAYANEGFKVNYHATIK